MMRDCFDSLFSGTSSGALLINKMCVIEQANEAAAELLGYTPTELLNRPVESLVFREPYEDSHQLQNVCSNQGDTLIELEKRLIRKDNSLVWVHFCLQTGYDLPGHTWYGVLICTDISYRKELETKLRKLLGQQEAVMQQLHQQVKHNMALLQLAESLPGKYLSEQGIDSAPASCFTKRVKGLPWVYSSLYIREKTTGINLQKHLQTLASQLMLPYNTSYPGPKLSLAIDPVFVSAHFANILSLMVYELLEQALLTECAHIKLSFGNIRGTHHSQLSWLCKADTPLTGSRFMHAVEMVSVLAESLQGEATLSHSADGSVRLDICFHEFARYTEQAPNSFAYYALAGR